MTSRSYITLMIFGAITLAVVIFFADRSVNAWPQGVVPTPATSDLERIAERVQNNLAGAASIEDRLASIRSQLPSVEEFAGAAGVDMPPTPAAQSVPTELLIPLPTPASEAPRSPDVYALPTLPPPVAVTPTSIPIFSPLWRGGQLYLYTPQTRYMPCSDIWGAWGGGVGIQAGSPFEGWFMSLDRQTQLAYFDVCNYYLTQSKGES